MEGNGRATRIRFDLIFRRSLHKVIDWKQIDRTDYLYAMECSPINDLELRVLLQGALTSDIDNCEVIIKGIE